MAHLDAKERWKGVIAVSAGNHAQGVAYSARKLKIPATIVMPEGTPGIKHLNVARLGANVVLSGHDFDTAKLEAQRREKLHDLTNIPPFDDPYVIAGQGTIGMELLQQIHFSEVEAIFCCVGGGGLIAGIGTFIKRFAPQVKIIGVEAYEANAMVESLKKGRRVVLDQVGLFADGAAVRTVGEENFRLCKEVIDEIIEVTKDEICAAIKDVFDDTRSTLEPAGALSVAGLKKWVAAHPSTNPKRGIVAIASGANMDFDRLGFVAERARLGEKKEALLTVEIPEQPGAFAELIKNVLPHGVTEFSYRYATPGTANILMGISVGAGERERAVSSLVVELKKASMVAIDISENELAKNHIRYLVGGRSSVPNERLYAFEFPERPGALIKFLTTLKPGFNISLFHYRNHGGDIAQVLAGIQCRDEDIKELESFLQDLGYPYKDETHNEVYTNFMRDDSVQEVT
jgi:threonine dehydratase